MPWIQLVAKAAPALLKQAPKLWPLLLESRNRQWLVDTARQLANLSPQHRLRGRAEVTAALAEGLEERATDADEARVAADWARRARNLALRLDVPVTGREAGKRHRDDVARRLDDLQQEMNRHLEG